VTVENLLQDGANDADGIPARTFFLSASAIGNDLQPVGSVSTPFSRVWHRCLICCLLVN
jgi:hypothetical protein